MMTWENFPEPTFVRSETEGVIRVEAALDPCPEEDEDGNPPAGDVYDLRIVRVLENDETDYLLDIVVLPSEDPAEVCIAELEPYLGETVDCGDPEMLDPIGRAAERARVRASGTDEIAEEALHLCKEFHWEEWDEFFRDEVENSDSVEELIEEHFMSYVRDYLDETA